MQEENKGDKIRRVLQLYAKLSDGYVINKAEEAAYYGVTERSITNDIVEWTRTVVDRLNPSLRAYPNKQIDLALALILYEQTLRDASYGSVFCKFTEVYKNEGGVF